MNKKVFANGFGLAIALMVLSLTAPNVAFAAAGQGPQQVVVTNTPAQPVPIVGLVTDADNPARQYFQTNIVDITVNGGGMFYKITSAPAIQKLVIERVSGWCPAPVYSMFLRTLPPSAIHGDLMLPASFWNGTGTAYLPVRFYVKPGDDFGIFIDASGGGAVCHLTFGGYYVN
jgi:hypothetical protein